MVIKIPKEIRKKVGDIEMYGSKKYMTRSKSLSLKTAATDFSLLIIAALICCLI